MSIGLIDTCIMCNILKVSGMHQRFNDVMQQLRNYINEGYTLLLPVATIIETGNHVAQNGDGTQRRETAQHFVKVVNDAIEDKAPWTISKTLFDVDIMTEYLIDFPDSAMRGMGFGDLSIIKEYDNLCSLHSARCIFIWSLDEHLSGYIREIPDWVR